MEFSGTIEGLEERLLEIERRLDLLLRQPDSTWLNVNEAAAHLSLTPAALRAHAHRDSSLPRHRVGERGLRFRRDELDAWMLSRE